jgi:hypothetical protein
MTGNFDGFDLLPAMLDHARPAFIEDLHLATLGFNHANAARLLELMDAGAVRRCMMIVSLYYEADPKEADTCYQLAQELPARGDWYCATRSHAKIIAARFTDGRCFVIESSANLRTCHNLEQFTITQDRGLFTFHREWMESVHRRDHTTAPRRIARPERPHLYRRNGTIAWSLHRSMQTKDAVVEAKSGMGSGLTRWADPMAAMITAMVAPQKSRAVVTTPPQGASWPGHYHAADLATATANRLGLDFRHLLNRTDTKDRHGPWSSLQQSPYDLTQQPGAPIVVIVDDLITSGTTIRLSVEALRSTGAAIHAFAINTVPGGKR